jgi:hypothetical protein
MQERRGQETRMDVREVEGLLRVKLYCERDKGLCTGISLRYGETNKCVGRPILVC